MLYPFSRIGVGRFETRWSREDGQYERICGWVCLLFGGYADEIRSYEDSSVSGSILCSAHSFRALASR